jgi:hypothetical protein
MTPAPAIRNCMQTGSPTAWRWWYRYSFGEQSRSKVVSKGFWEAG